jgi:hypothetical protein
VQRPTTQPDEVRETPTVDVDVPTKPSADLPHEAIFERGSWRYKRQISTKRGLSDRTFASESFTQDDLDSQHFKDLRSARNYARREQWLRPCGTSPASSNANNYK